ncbi:MAG TPA: GPW/gp25 family protein [Thermoanaerobaculia bacterium]|nr:GPW/gp25 family protein [Thermoanaerobaculia bacterium]
MNPGTLYGRGIAFPPRVGADGRIVWSEGEQNIRENIEIILRTEERERLNLPSFGGGLRKFLFEPNTVTTRFQIQDRITRALQQWEPRVIVTSVDVDEDPRDPQSAIATVNYQLVATRAAAQVSLRVSLGG